MQKQQPATAIAERAPTYVHCPHRDRLMRHSSEFALGPAATSHSAVRGALTKLAAATYLGACQAVLGSPNLARCL